MTASREPVLAVVPARGGSKGIPRKNLRQVGGRSLIARAAQVALAAPSITWAILSTDDPEMADEGRRHGLEVPFLRPAELADDRADAVSMWRHAWLTAEETSGDRFGSSVLLEPTSPLRRVEDVQRTLRALQAGAHRAAATVSRTPAHYTPHKSLVIAADGTLRHLLGTEASPSLRQAIPEQYHRNGVCYAVRRETLLDRGTIVEDDCIAVVIDRPVVNVDEPFDLELAEWLLSREGEGG